MQTTTTERRNDGTTVRRYLYALFVLWYLFCVVYNNIIIEEQTYRDFFLDQKEQGVAHSLMESTGIFGSFFTIFSELSGTETGYGFYAPNVSSQMVVIFTVKDSLGNIVNVTMPQFSSNETRLRYFTVFDTFLDKLDPSDEKYDRFLDVILKSLAFRTLRNHPPHRMIEADIYIYDLPYMPDYRQGARPQYTPLLHYVYRLKS